RYDADDLQRAAAPVPARLHAVAADRRRRGAVAVNHRARPSIRRHRSRARWLPHEMTGRIVSINISGGGVPKRAVEEADVRSLGIVGDVQRNRQYHGGPDRALCLYSMDWIDALRAEGHPIAPGTTGENVTVHGVDWALLVPGIGLHLGAVHF